MSVYKEMSMAAAAAATAASFLILRPWAFYAAAGIGTMVADPEGMEDAARNWHTTDRAGLTAELDQLDQQMGELKTQLKEQGKWEGEAFQAFDAIHTDFKNSVHQLKETRNATGDAVQSTAGFYKIGAVVCMAVAAYMLEYGIWKRFISTTPPGILVAEAADPAAGAAAVTPIRRMLGKHAVVVAGLGLTLQQAVSMSEATGKIFPTLQAVPTEMTAMRNGKVTLPPFTNGGMDYDEGSGSLVPHMEDDGRIPGLPI